MGRYEILLVDKAKHTRDTYGVEIMNADNHWQRAANEDHPQVYDRTGRPIAQRREQMYRQQAIEQAIENTKSQRKYCDATRWCTLGLSY